MEKVARRRSKKPKIHPFEFIGVYKLVKEERFLLADDMGMYKTAQAIFANNTFRDKNKRKVSTLVVCPTSVREHWAKEIQRWAWPRGQDITILNAPTLESDIRRARRSDWAIIHYPLLSRLNHECLQKMLRIRFRHVILDEVHNAKNPYALRTRAVKTIADRGDYSLL